MSRIYILISIALITCDIQAQNVGIDTNTPQEKLHVADGNIFLDRGTHLDSLVRKIILEGAMRLDSNSFATIDFNVFDPFYMDVFSGARISAFGNKSDNGFAGLKFETKSFSFESMKTRMTITGLGRVGIGTNQPVSKFHVYGGDIVADRGENVQNLRRFISIGGARKDDNPYAELLFSNYDDSVSVAYTGAKISSIAGASGIASGDLRFFTTDQYTLQERLLIDRLGNVGIGTSNPLSKLHLFGGNIIADRGNATQNLSRFLIIGGALKSPGPYAELYFRNYDHNEAQEYTGAKITSVAGSTGVGSGDIRFFTANGFSLFEHMVLTKTGNLGISNQDPSELLSVGDDFGSTLTGNRITIGDIDNTSGLNLGEDIDNRGFILWDNSNDCIYMGTRSSATTYNNTIALNNGNVGIGNNSAPLYDLHIGDGNISAINVSNTRAVVSDNDNGQRAAFLGLTKTSGGSRVEAQLEANGSNTSGPSVIMGAVSSHPLYLRTGNITRMTVLPNGNVGINHASPAYNLQVNGSAAKTGGGAWTNPSDLRFKENISNYKDGLTQVLSIRPVQFEYTSESGYKSDSKEIGVIAQELQEIAPYMVGTIEKDDEEYLSVNNSAMVYMLINSVKELNQKLEDLEAEIAMLKGKSPKSE